MPTTIARRVWASRVAGSAASSGSSSVSERRVNDSTRIAWQRKVKGRRCRNVTPAVPGGSLRDGHHCPEVRSIAKLPHLATNPGTDGTPRRSDEYKRRATEQRHVLLRLALIHCNIHAFAPGSVAF